MVDAMLRVAATLMPLFKCKTRGSPLVAAVPDGIEWDCPIIGAKWMGHGSGDYSVNNALSKLESGGRIDYQTFDMMNDGLSNTVLMAEIVHGYWLEPRRIHGYPEPWVSANEFVSLDNPPCGGVMSDDYYTAVREDRLRDIADFSDPDWFKNICVDFLRYAGSAHAAGVPAAFADGSVHVVRFTIPPKTWRALCTPAGVDIASIEN